MLAVTVMVGDRSYLQRDRQVQHPPRRPPTPNRSIIEQTGRRPASQAKTHGTHHVDARLGLEHVGEVDDVGVVQRLEHTDLHLCLRESVQCA